MPPVHRWLLCSLGALASGLALAQTAATPVAAPAPPEVDESKIPEWVKRQARSPYKVIIESHAVRGRTAAAKEDGNLKQAQKKPAAVVAPAPAAMEPRGEAAVARVAEPASKTGSVAAVPLATEPASETAAALIATLPSTQQPATLPSNATAAALEPAAQGPAAIEPALRVATAPLAEPTPLTLLRRVEPAFPIELIDSKLNRAKVVVAFTVNPDGEVRKPSITSTSDQRLNRSVLRAVRDWRYAPIEAAREHSVRFEFSIQ